MYGGPLQFHNFFEKESNTRPALVKEEAVQGAYFSFLVSFNN